MPHDNNIVQLGPDCFLHVPSLLEARLMVQANSGGGKSYAVRKICEITYGHAQQIVIDPEGEFHTLREKYDYSYAGEGGDAPVTIASAGMLARTLLELRQSAVIDIYELGARRAEFIARFFEAVMTAPRSLWHDVIFVIDEINKYCPEDKGISGDLRDSRDAINDMMTRGRKRGYCGILATQRISDVSKTSAAECNNLMIGRTGLDVDVARSGKRLGMSPRDQMEKLSKLEPGTFYVTGPAFDTPALTTIRVGTVETHHPRRGHSYPVPAPRGKAVELLGRLRQIPAEAASEATTIAEVRELNVRLLRENQSLKKDNPDGQRNLTNAEAARDEYYAAWQQTMVERDAAVTSARELKTQLINATAILKRSRDVIMEWMPPHEVNVTETTSRMLADHKQSTAVKKPAIEPRPKPAPSMADGLKPPLLKVLDLLLLFEQIGMTPTTEMIAAWHGVAPNSKGIRNYLSTLRTLKMVDGIALTDRGRSYASKIERPTRAEIRDRLWANVQAAHRPVMQAILDHGPVPKAELAKYFGQAELSKGMANYVSSLRTLGLVNQGWPATAAKVWFA